MKLSMLDVYLEPGLTVEIDTSHSDLVTVPYSSIREIEKTRLRVEYLIVVPVLYGLFVANFTVGSSF
jgi:hypothetical protein